MQAVMIPKRLLELARERGVDVESRVTDLLLRDLSLNPDAEAEVHVEVAERYLKEAREQLSKADSV